MFGFGGLALCLLRSTRLRWVRVGLERVGFVRVPIVEVAVGAVRMDSVSGSDYSHKNSGWLRKNPKSLPAVAT